MKYDISDPKFHEKLKDADPHVQAAAKAALKEVFISAITSPGVGNPIVIGKKYVQSGIGEDFVQEALQDIYR